MIKPIEDFDGYFISSEGKVYCNLGKGNRDRNKRCDMYEVNPRITRNGYLRVYMRQNSTGKRVDRYIHRLVAEHFISNPCHKPCINHKDCNRTNNLVANLEWVTHKENNAYTMQMEHVYRDVKGRFCA